jgi:hypothetical protein
MSLSKKLVVGFMAAALVTALMFTGCPQDAEDEGNNGTGKLTVSGLSAFAGKHATASMATASASYIFGYESKEGSGIGSTTFTLPQISASGSVTIPLYNMIPPDGYMDYTSSENVTSLVIKILDSPASQLTPDGDDYITTLTYVGSVLKTSNGSLSVTVDTGDASKWTLTGDPGNSTSDGVLSVSGLTGYAGKKAHAYLIIGNPMSGGTVVQGFEDAEASSPATIAQDGTVELTLYQTVIGGAPVAYTESAVFDKVEIRVFAEDKTTITMQDTLPSAAEHIAMYTATNNFSTVNGSASANVGDTSVWTKTTVDEDSPSDGVLSVSGLTGYAGKKAHAYLLIGNPMSGGTVVQGFEDAEASSPATIAQDGTVELTLYQTVIGSDPVAYTENAAFDKVEIRVFAEEKATIGMADTLPSATGHIALYTATDFSIVNGGASANVSDTSIWTKTAVGD